MQFTHLAMHASGGRAQGANTARGERKLPLYTLHPEGDLTYSMRGQTCVGAYK